MDSPQTEQPSSVPSPLSQLSGPDGKPLQTSEPPIGRQMPSRRDKFNLVFMMFTLMDREERRQLRKLLKAMQPRLDVMYPAGMKEGDIKNELTQAANEIIPEGEGHAEPENAEVATERCVAVQPEGGNGTVEGAPGGPQ